MVPCRKSSSVENLSKKEWVLAFFQVVIASVFLACISIFKVPLYPTPMTLQTLGVFLIPLVLGPNKGALAVILYLVEATCGWPILSGGVANPLWMITPNAGFLLTFPFAAYVIGKLSVSFPSGKAFTTFTALTLGQVMICLGGVLGLACFFGFEKALAYGVTPFFVAMSVKIILATAIYHGLLNLKNRKQGKS